MSEQPEFLPAADSLTATTDGDHPRPERRRRGPGVRNGRRTRAPRHTDTPDDAPGTAASVLVTEPPLPVSQVMAVPPTASGTPPPVEEAPTPTPEADSTLAESSELPVHEAPQPVSTAAPRRRRNTPRPAATVEPRPDSEPAQTPEPVEPATDTPASSELPAFGTADTLEAATETGTPSEEPAAAGKETPPRRERQRQRPTPPPQESAAPAIRTQDTPDHQPVQVFGLPPGTRADDELLAILRQADRVLAAGGSADELGGQGLKLQRLPNARQVWRKFLLPTPGEQLAVVVPDDPLHHPVTQWLARHLPPGTLHCAPLLSPLLRAFYTLGVPWQDAQFIDLRQGSLAGLATRLRTNQVYAVRFGNEHASQPLGRLLQEAGLGATQVCLFALNQADGEPDVWLADELALIQSRELAGHFALMVTPRAARSVDTEFPGGNEDWLRLVGENSPPNLLPAAARLVTQAGLQAAAGSVHWLIGDVSWSLALELARFSQAARILVWPESDACADRLLKLTGQWGLAGQVQVARGRNSPLAGWPEPDGILIANRKSGNPRQYDEAWQKLRGGGRLVMVASTETQKVDLARFSPGRDSIGLGMVDLSVACAQRDDHGLVMHPQLPVRIAQWQKKHSF